MQLANHRKWKFPRSPENNGSLSNFVMLTIATLVVVVVFLSPDLTSIGCEGVIRATSPSSVSSQTGDHWTPVADNCALADCHPNGVSRAAASQKPSRLDANENELMTIELDTPTAEVISVKLPKVGTQSQSSSSSLESRAQAPAPEVAESFQPSDLMNLLDLQQQHHQQTDHNSEPSGIDTLINAKRLARSINRFDGAGYAGVDSESDSPQILDTNENMVDDGLVQLEAPSQQQQQQRSELTASEREARDRADLINRLALEDQQRKQDQMQSAQEQHVARAIRDQQAALNQQQNILMKQQLDEALNDSENYREWRRSLHQNSPNSQPTNNNNNNNPQEQAATHINSYEPALDDDSDESDSQEDIDSASSSSTADDGSIRDVLSGPRSNNESPETKSFLSEESRRISTNMKKRSPISEQEDDDNNDNEQAEEASNLNQNYDLITSAQHHNYGSHYGSLHKHQSKYFQ